MAPKAVTHRTLRPQHRGTPKLRFITMKGLKIKISREKDTQGCKTKQNKNRCELLEPSPKESHKTPVSPSSKEL